MNTYQLSGRIDSSNAGTIEKEIRDVFAGGFPQELTLDASHLQYISSAGLRVLLRIKKEIKHLRMVHINRDIYEILEMTGFDQILETEKALRRISIEGCSEIGRGAHGTVYRIEPDTIVKVYHPGEPMEEIRRERELAKWAFVRDVPTAIPYDIVRVGDCYGAVFELLDARSAVEYIQESPAHLEDFIERSVRLMKQIHAIQAEPGELPDMKAQMLEWMGSVRRLQDNGQGGGLTGAVCDQLEKTIRETPDSLTLLHADLHLKNIMISEDELMVIDMDTLCTGDPVFDLATVYNSYRQFPSIDPAAAAFLGIDVETSYRICDRTMELYLDEAEPAQRAQIVQKAQIFGCVRIIDYMIRNQDLPKRDAVIERCLQDIAGYSFS